MSDLWKTGCRNKMKQTNKQNKKQNKKDREKYDTVGTIPKSNIKIVETNAETKIVKYICLLVSFIIIDVMLIFFIFLFKLRIQESGSKGG